MAGSPKIQQRSLLPQPWVCAYPDKHFGRMKGMGNTLASRQTAANCLFTILILEQPARTAQRLQRIT